MLPARMEPTSTGHGLPGTLRIVAAVLIGCLATFAVLAVLGLLPQDVLARYAGKALAIGGIVVVATAAIALVLGAGRAR